MTTAQKWPDIMYVVRHGQSDRNVMKDAAKANGSSMIWSDGIRDQDTPLTQLGILQSLSVGVELRKRHPKDPPPIPPCSFCDHLDVLIHQDALRQRRLRGPVSTIFVSPYLRARQTTEEIMEGLGYEPKVVVEERIREIEFGILDGLSPEGIRVKYPEEIARRAREGKYYYRAPGGENRPDVNLRLHSFIDTVVRDYNQQVIVVVCHSVVVLCLRHLLERWDEAEYLLVDKEQDVKNASVTTYHCENNKIRLKAYNEIFYPESAV
jgi:broad specificity phosphatase PhoE